jgi:hypothetical protein
VVFADESAESITALDLAGDVWTGVGCINSVAAALQGILAGRKTGHRTPSEGPLVVSRAPQSMHLFADAGDASGVRTSGGS